MTAHVVFLKTAAPIQMIVMIPMRLAIQSYYLGCHTELQEVPTIPEDEDTIPSVPEDAIPSVTENTIPVNAIPENLTPSPEKEESQPTPPPRKKKLKKKLEQLVEQKLNLEGSIQLNVQGKEYELTTNSDVVEKSSALEEKCSEVAEPKKSRRKKKHAQ